jgi:hypothetical protein
MAATLSARAQAERHHLEKLINRQGAKYAKGRQAN